MPYDIGYGPTPAVDTNRRSTVAVFFLSCQAHPAVVPVQSVTRPVVRAAQVLRGPHKLDFPFRVDHRGAARGRPSAEAGVAALRRVVS